MKTFLLICLQNIVEQKIEFNIESDLIRTYDDSSGQRSAYLEYYGYSRQDPEHYPTTFKVRRKLTFTNTEDIGKEDAVLFTLNVDKVKNILISDTYIKLDELKIYLRNPIIFT